MQSLLPESPPPPAPLHVHGQARKMPGMHGHLCRCVTQKMTEIDAVACGCMQPQTSALIFLQFWAMHGPEESGNLGCCVRLHVATRLGIAQNVGTSMLMHVALRSH